MQRLIFADPMSPKNVKYIACQGPLRAELVALQQAFADRFEKVVTEGRDQGTVVFPNAPYKFFLTADPKERARRRHEELKAGGTDMAFRYLAGTDSCAGCIVLITARSDR